MSYGAPYHGPAAYSSQPQYGQSYDAPFDPYGARQPHETYDQSGYDGGYRDEPSFAANNSREPLEAMKEEPETYSVTLRENPTSRSFRSWRYNNQGNLWTKGSRPRCICRFFGCTVLIALFLIISIVLSLALWIRPPNITIGNVELPQNGSAFQVLDDGIQVNLNIAIGVENPNYFSVNLRSIKVDLFYPINNTNVGGGEEKDITFHSHTNTNFSFPFTFKYTESADPNQAIIADLATKCLASPPKELSVNYKITLGLRVLFIVASPVISNKFSFACPLSGSDIENALKTLGLGGGAAGALGGLLGN
ncbi:hypothetical protein EWM64_g317 [Hericium alpestre]|uniref:Late embryogenesis abundant protein LEA-2 subgroup domain-containing protein n=1 Tax=Hericium alpestre TaxID=135208 RepID=A0A4Z0ABH0_9AGAM|nr:hypothetical protein EWM64_g317 [Hericium alpestre]